MTLWLATTNSHKIKEIESFFKKISEQNLKDQGLNKQDVGVQNFKKDLETQDLGEQDLEIKNKIKHFKKFNRILFKGLKDIEDYTPPKETGKTFKQNAKIKSTSLFNFLKNKNLLKDKNTLVLGEDSGIEVFALNKEPGIYSARYALLFTNPILKNEKPDAHQAKCNAPKTNDQKNNDLLLYNLKDKQDRRAKYICALSVISANGEQYFFEGFCHGLIALKESGNHGFGYDPLFIPEKKSQTFGNLPKDYKDKVSHRNQALIQLTKKILSNT